MRVIKDTILNLLTRDVADENEGISEESINAQQQFHKRRIPHNKSIEKATPMQQNNIGGLFKQ